MYGPLLQSILWRMHICNGYIYHLAHRPIYPIAVVPDHGYSFTDQTCHSAVLCVDFFLTKVRDHRCYYSNCELMNQVPQLSSWCLRWCGHASFGLMGGMIQHCEQVVGSRGGTASSPSAALPLLTAYGSTALGLEYFFSVTSGCFLSCMKEAQSWPCLMCYSCKHILPKLLPCWVNFFLSFAGSFQRWQSLLNQL